MLLTVASIIIVIAFLAGIHLMQSPETAVAGNRLGLAGMTAAILLVLWNTGSPSAGILLVVGGLIGFLPGQLVTMIQMPQAIALLTGCGGAPALVSSGRRAYPGPAVNRWCSGLRRCWPPGLEQITLVGSIVAALKLQGWLSQRPVLSPP